VRIGIFHIVLLLTLGLWSCSTKKIAKEQPEEITAKKTPEQYLSRELSYVSKTVQKLESVAFYRSYVFSPRNTVELSKINDSILEVHAISNHVSNQSVSGTATVIYFDGSIVGMLTCAHVVDFPDTIVVGYNHGRGPIKALSVKVRQKNYVNGLPLGDDVEVIAIDRKLDIAFMKKRLYDAKENIPVLKYPAAKDKDLDWGMQVYVMGYPLGRLMVTRGIVSKPSGSTGRFLTDALYNRGISGSPVITVGSGNPPDVRWLGIASSAAAQKISYVKPEKNTIEFINTDESYSGELYLDRKKIINYGVTYNITSEAVLDFLMKNDDKIRAAGFNPESFFK